MIEATHPKQRVRSFAHNCARMAVTTSDVGTDGHTGQIAAPSLSQRVRNLELGLDHIAVIIPALQRELEHVRAELPLVGMKDDSE